MVNFNSELPTVHLRVSSQNLIFTYREWRKSGVKETGSWNDQESRWQDFLLKWRKIRGRVICMGDFNIEYWRSVSRHHQDCAVMKDMLMEDIVSTGYVQLIRDVTRRQGSSSSCLDHIYMRSPQYIFHDSICNKIFLDMIIIISPVMSLSSLQLTAIESDGDQKSQEDGEGRL